MSYFNQYHIQQRQQQIRDEVAASRIETAMPLRKIYQQLYLWTAAALLLTALCASWTVHNPGLIQQIHDMNFGFLVLVVGIYVGAQVLMLLLYRIPMAIAVPLLAACVMATGVLVASAFFLLTQESVERVFFVTSAMFLVMGIYGLLLKQDLGNSGNLVLLALVGLALAWVANRYLFIDGHVSIYASYIGVIVQVICAAIAAAQISQLGSLIDEKNKADIQLFAVRGTLLLYLIFLSMLSLVLFVFTRAALAAMQEQARMGIKQAEKDRRGDAFYR